MNKEIIRLIPGPVSVPKSILKTYSANYASADIDTDFLDLYNRTEKKIQQILGTQNSVIMQTGEGMLGLWGALKNCLTPGSKVLALCNGVFGDGIADMAESIGANVKRFSVPYNTTEINYSDFEKAVAEFEPFMITTVHCETPSGILNPLEEIAKIKQKYQVPLFCVDSVASSGGTPVDADKCAIDLCLNGSQKCFSAPPEMTMVSVSSKAWEIIEKVNYKGYDAFLPFKNAQKNFYFPNTMSWHGVAALEAASDLILNEGLENVYNRHKTAQEFCIRKLSEMGLELFADKNAVKSPTVTAVMLPKNIDFDTFNKACLSKGIALASSYGPLAGRIFRIGHMGAQSDLKLLEVGMTRLGEAIEALK
ncbi:MAG: aminotransferase class V-fold PLP-dependent enzyme [Candidatus Riflebacteria bacterium]|nr:aminotransferase class V-fold PLP-dependent enzyme [Candidatus Riflebacteria bacterium]